MISDAIYSLWLLLYDFELIQVLCNFAWFFIRRNNEQVLECHRYNVGAAASPLLWKTGYTTN